MLQGNTISKPASSMQTVEISRSRPSSMAMPSQQLIPQKLPDLSAPWFSEIIKPFLPSQNPSSHNSEEIQELESCKFQEIQPSLQHHQLSKKTEKQSLSSIKITIPNTKNSSFASSQVIPTEIQKSQSEQERFERKIQLNDDEAVLFSSSLITEHVSAADIPKIVQPNDDIKIQNSIQKISNNILERTFTLNTTYKKITFKDSYNVIPSGNKTKYQDQDQFIQQLKMQQAEMEQQKLISAQKNQEILTQYESMLNDLQQRLIASDQRVEWLNCQVNELNQQNNKLVANLHQQRSIQEELDKQLKLFSSMNDSLRQQLQFILSQNNTLMTTTSQQQQQQQPHSFQNTQNYFQHSKSFNPASNIPQNYGNTSSIDGLNNNNNPSNFINKNNQFNGYNMNINNQYQNNLNPNSGIQTGFMNNYSNNNSYDNNSIDVKNNRMSIHTNQSSASEAITKNTNHQLFSKPQTTIDSSQSQQLFSQQQSQENHPPKEPHVKMELNESNSIVFNDGEESELLSSPMKNPQRLVKAIKKDESKDEKKRKDRKNIAKNFIKAFRSFFNNLAEQQEIQEILKSKGVSDTQQSLESLRNQFNQTVQSNNINNEFIIFLIQHTDLSDIFRFFIYNRAEEWINTSQLKDKDVHLESLQLFKQAFNSNNALSKVRVNQHKNKKPIVIAPLI